MSNYTIEMPNRAQLVTSLEKLTKNTYLGPILLLACGISYIIFNLKRHPSVYDKFVRLGNPSWLPKFLGKGPQTLFSEGYNKIIVPSDRPFVVEWWSLDNLILPPKYLPDLQRVKSENASFLKNFSDAVRLQHSVGSLYESDRMGDILRKGLNPALSSLTPLIKEEIQRAMAAEIGACTDWKTFNTVELFIGISHRVVSRLLAGEELSRNEDFIHLSLKFGDSVFVTGLIISQLPLGIFRGPIGWLIAQYHRWTLYKLMKMVEPVVSKRVVEAREQPDLKSYNDSIEWAIKLNNPPERDSRTIALEMLHILEAAGGAPGAMMSEMMYQLLVEPEYMEPLLDEMSSTSKAFSDPNEVLRNLPLLDSFIMETNRMYPVGGVTAARTVMNESMVLHDGLTLPPGTRIGFTCKAIQLDQRNFNEPLRFDGRRFSRLNDIEGKHADGATRYIASSVTPTNLSWGYGKHACPGRFYAIKLAKLVFMELLPAYEIQAAGKPLVQHPPSFEVEGQFLPNLKQKIKIRARK